MNRDNFIELFDAIPANKWTDVERYLKIMAMPEEEATEDELEAFRLAEIDKANGELTSLADLRKKLFNE